MAILIFCLVTILPGAWLTFGLPLSEFSWKARLALAAALSPAILGAQFIALRFFGLSFETAALLAILINLPSLIFIVRTLRWPLITWPSAWHLSPTGAVGSLLFTLLAGYLVVPWTIIQNYRPFAWHALWHSDIVYAFTRHTIAPEEPELAGLTLAYGWIGHVYWGVVGWATNLPPTITYAISNLIWLLIAFILAYELAKRGLGLQSSAALLGVGLMFLGTNVIGAGAWLWAGDTYRWRDYLGDIRYTPFLSKYLGFETMPFAFALVLGLALVCVVALRTKVRWLPVIVTALLTALGLIYPVLFPIGCLLTGGMLGLMAIKLPLELPIYSWRAILLTALGIAISITIFLAFTRFITQAHSAALVQLSTRSEMFAKSLQVISAFVPLGLVALPFIGLWLWRRNAPVLLLATTGVGLLMMYVLFNVRSLEYKFILGATIMLAPFSAATLDWLLFKQTRLRWAWTLVIPLTLAVLQQGVMFRSGAQVPENRVNAPAIDERSFWLALDPAEPDAGWTTAVRNTTPLDTILVSAGSDIHLGPFTDRSFYMPADIDGETTTGYSIDTAYNLLEFRGYPTGIFEQRHRVIQSLYSSNDPIQVVDAAEEILRLNRPVAIHFYSGQARISQWLAQAGIGAQIFADDHSIVWFIDPQQELPSPSSLSHNAGALTNRPVDVESAQIHLHYPLNSSEAQVGQD